jgi:CPA1 family monovalent cation:H+ antiporter
VVVFLGIYEVVVSGSDISTQHFLQLFAQEALGGAVFGFVSGLIVLKMLKSVDNYQVEVLLTLALVMGGYTLANALHLSAPISVVVSGLMIGSLGRKYAMSTATEERLDTFWELLDEVLNAVLFLLIGLEVILLDFSTTIIVLGLTLSVLTLLARLISVGLPISAFKYVTNFNPHVIKILTWGGLRGGISVALALSIPAGTERDIFVALTYIIVVVSILVQGLTIRRLVAYASDEAQNKAA